MIQQLRDLQSFKHSKQVFTVVAYDNISMRHKVSILQKGFWTRQFERRTLCIGYNIY